MRKCKQGGGLNTPTKILIGIPFGRPPDLEPHHAWTTLMIRVSANPTYEIHGKYTNSASIDVNREDIAQASVDDSCDWCLMIDTDMSYPAHLLDTLISRDKDVIGVPYYSPRWNPNTKQDDVVPIVYKDVGDNYDAGWCRLKKIEQTQLFRLDAIGTGILLVKTKVFKKLEKPWFLIEGKKDNRIVGEDLRFCLECQKAGFEVWADPTFGDSIGHWKPYRYSLKDCTEK